MRSDVGAWSHLPYCSLPYTLETGALFLYLELGWLLLSPQAILWSPAPMHILLRTKVLGISGPACAAKPLTPTEPSASSCYLTHCQSSVWDKLISHVRATTLQNDLIWK